MTKFTSPSASDLPTPAGYVCRCGPHLNKCTMNKIKVGTSEPIHTNGDMTSLEPRKTCHVCIRTIHISHSWAYVQLSLPCFAVQVSLRAIQAT